MQTSTISVSPVPQGTTVQKMRQIFHAFSVKNVHIDGKTAFVEFNDQGDLQNLDIQFDNYEVTDLNNARIDKAEFDWNTVKKQNSSPQKKSDSSSSHQDLMAAQIDNLIIIENCDEFLLKNLSQEDIRNIFHDFHSVHRIVKRNKDVIVEFTDVGQMEKLEGKFPNFNIGQLGFNSQIQKAQVSKISPDQFVSQWSKFHTKQSQMTQASTNLGYKEQKPQQQEERFQIGSQQSKPSQQVLHQDIIPPFDKKTSMQVNFLSEQSKLGYNQEQKKETEPIHEASTNQQLDYTTELQIKEDDDRFGYDALQNKQEAQKKAQAQRKLKEELQIKRKQQEQKVRKQQDEKARKVEQQKIRKAEQQRVRKVEQERRKKQEQQRQRKIEQEQRATKAALQQARKQARQQQLDRQFQQKLQIERQKHMKQQQQRKIKQQNTKKEKQHHIPTQSENAAKQISAIKHAQQSIEKQLGYAVNKAKQQSANLLNAGLELLKGTQQKPKQQKYGYDSETSKKQVKHQQSQLGYEKPTKVKQAKQIQKIVDLGYKRQNPQQAGLDLLSSSLQFIKGSYSKIQQQFGSLANKVKQEAHPSELGYEKWSVKPDVNIPRPVIGQQPRTLKTLITVTLFIWVIFLLMQSTGQVSEENHSIDIGIPVVNANQQPVASESQNI